MSDGDVVGLDEKDEKKYEMDEKANLFILPISTLRHTSALRDY